MTPQQTCFVVQGFGEKTDLTTGRTLNLDASYDVIKEAVEDAGLKCIRADEIIHSGTIDKPTYEWLYRADLVIADLSTYNLNAAYELGVRYGLRPEKTLVVAESQFRNPFDVSHMIIHLYEHLGREIGLREARRFKDVLGRKIASLMAEPNAVDSPVYIFLPLHPPAAATAAVAASPSSHKGTAARVSGSATVVYFPKRGQFEYQPQYVPDYMTDPSAKDLFDQARSAVASGNFAGARALFAALHATFPRDEYVVQQLALATYKSRAPDALSALHEAQRLLRELGPETTIDPKTLGLWGDIHKRLWDLTKDSTHLDGSIAAYKRGFYLRQDHYNGINLAFLLNVRSAIEQDDGNAADAVADFVLARRVRRQVVRLCATALAAGPRSIDDKYWILAAMWEAAMGSGDSVSAENLKKEVEALAVPKWMVDATISQLAQLELFLAASPLELVS